MQLVSHGDPTGTSTPTEYDNGGFGYKVSCFRREEKDAEEIFLFFFFFLSLSLDMIQPVPTEIYGDWMERLKRRKLSTPLDFFKVTDSSVFP